MFDIGYCSFYDAYMEVLFRPTVLKSISAVSSNMSAAWFSAAFIAPAFVRNPYWIFVLTNYILAGILFLGFTIFIEELLNTYES